MNDVKLRDQRKPGHCWQDNELYDAFGPVIGPNAVTVYTHMTRQCYGTEIRSSSRELAAASGLSKDTVLRSMRAMERIGMLRAVGRGLRSVAEYHLVDLKELAESHGGVYDRRRVSYVFTDQQTAALKAMAAGAFIVSATVAPVASAMVSPIAGATGAGGDSQQSATVAGGDSAAPHLALGKPTSGAGEAQPYTRQQNCKDNPPTPQRGANDPDGEDRVAALRLQRKASPIGSPEWWQASRALQAALQAAAPEKQKAQTGPDPPPGRGRRRWTAAMVGMAR